MLLNIISQGNPTEVVDYSGGILTVSNNVVSYSAGASSAYKIACSEPTYTYTASNKYAEFTVDTLTSGSDLYLGISDEDKNPTTSPSSGKTYWLLRGDGNLYERVLGSFNAAGTGLSFAAGDVIGVLYDDQKIYMRKNGGGWMDNSGGTTGNPATGANPTFTGLPEADTLQYIVQSENNTASWQVTADLFASV